MRPIVPNVAQVHAISDPSQLHLTVLTSTGPACLTKQYALGPDGALVKSSGGGVTWAGHAEHVVVDDLAGLIVLLDDLHEDQAVAFGVPIGTAPGGSLPYVTREKLLAHPDAIARTREHFEWPAGPGVMLLDCDTELGGADEFRARLLEAVPELADAPMLIRPSASSGIVLADTGEVLHSPTRGLHALVPVVDARLIPAAGAVLAERLKTYQAAHPGQRDRWAWTATSASGGQLERCIVDCGVWQPERLSFEVPAKLGAGLLRDVPALRGYGDPAGLFDLVVLGAGDIEARLQSIAGGNHQQVPMLDLPVMSVTTTSAPSTGTVDMALLAAQSAFAGVGQVDHARALARLREIDLSALLEKAGNAYGTPTWEAWNKLIRSCCAASITVDEFLAECRACGENRDEVNVRKVYRTFDPGRGVTAASLFADVWPLRAPVVAATPASSPQATPAPARVAPAASATPVPASVPAPPAPGVGAVLTSASDIAPRAVDWAWRGWMACSMVHLLAGAPGTGKTTIALALAAAVTTGGRWPDQSPATLGSVVLWSGEDSPEYTLVPRLAAMGANLKRVQIVTGARGADGLPVPFDPARDMAQLAAAVAAVGDVRLLILDPIVSAVTGDSHKATEVRRALQPIVDLAAQIGAAVLGITHLAKGTAGRDPTERVLGSVSFAAVVRLVMMAARVKGEDGAPDVRVLVRSKSNIGPDDGGFEYSLAQSPVPGLGEPASVVNWGKAITGSAKEIMKEPTIFDAADKDQADGRRGAEDFLRQVLAAGPVEVKAVETEAGGAGISWSAVRRAKDRMNVIALKDGTPVEGSKQPSWRWRLPQSEVAPSPSA